MQDQMPSAKRVRESTSTLTHGGQPPSSSSSESDMSAHLRSVAARVRKNVTEGYVIAPSFSKSYSTGDIFCSANDTLRDIFPPAASRTTETLVLSKKRARPHSDQSYDSDQQMAEDDHDVDIALYEEQHPGTLGRPMKPLRRTPRKVMMITRSLPGGSMMEGKATSDAPMDDEEDWSVQDVQPVSSGHTTPFEPVIYS